MKQNRSFVDCSMPETLFFLLFLKKRSGPIFSKQKGEKSSEIAHMKFLYTFEMRYEMHAIANILPLAAVRLGA